MKKICRLENLDCAHCAAEMEHACEKIPGVESVSVSFLTQKLVLRADDDKMEEILDQAIKVCGQIEPDCVIHRS